MPKKRTMPAEPARPPELVEHLDEALRSGRALVSIFHIENNDIRFYRWTIDYPAKDFAESVRLLRDSLAKEAREAAAAVQGESTRVDPG